MVSMVLIAALAAVAVTSCLPRETQQDVDRVTAEIATIEKQIETLVEKHKAGTLTTAEVLVQGETLYLKIAELKNKIVAIKEKYDQPWWEIAGGIIFSILCGAGGYLGGRIPAVNALSAVCQGVGSFLTATKSATAANALKGKIAAAEDSAGTRDWTRALREKLGL